MEVKKEVKEVKNLSLLDIVYSSLESGKQVKEICQELSISKQKAQYYLNQLKEKGLVKKIGYGLWQTNKGIVANSCRGHSFMWHIKLPCKITGWENILEKKGINFTKINKDHTFQIYFRDRKVWISKKSLVIYEINSYFGQNAIDTRKLAFFELKSLLISLQSKLGVVLTNKQGDFIVKPSRQHYSLIKNCLAVQCNKEGKKINVYNERGLWFTIDNSFNLDEAETVHPKTALTDNLGIQKYFNELKETHFEVTPKFILESFARQQAMLSNYQEQNQLLTKQISSHLKLINEYRKENIKWRKETEKKILTSNKNQTRLTEF